MAYQSPSFWQPSVMSSAPVNYPALPFPNGPQRPQNTLLNYHQAHNQQLANIPAISGGSGMPIRGVNTAAQNTFGVKSGDFGGAGVFGVKTGDFGNPNPNTGDIQWNTMTVGGSGGAGGRGTGGSGGPFGGAGNLANWYQDALNRANQANEARYRDALGGYQSRYERGMGMLSGLGQQEGRDINELYDSQAASQRQGLVGRGLGNSTVLDTMLMGNERERNADLGRLNDRVRNQALSQDSNLSGDVLQFMERKTDKPPDIGLLAQLYQGMGQGGYGMGGFGGGGYGGGGYGQPDYSGGFNPYMFQQYPSYGGSSPQNQARLAAARANYAQQNAAQDFSGNGANARYGYSGTGPASTGANWATPPGYGVPPEDTSGWFGGAIPDFIRNHALPWGSSAGEPVFPEYAGGG